MGEARSRKIKNIPEAIVSVVCAIVVRLPRIALALDGVELDIVDEFVSRSSQRRWSPSIDRRQAAEDLSQSANGWYLLCMMLQRPVL